MMSLNEVSISHYGNYDSKNPNDIVVTIGQLDIYFSYRTIVAYRTIDQGLICSENVWSVTTGKHLNWIQPDKEKRLSFDEFQDRLDETLEGFGLYV